MKKTDPKDQLSRKETPHKIEYEMLNEAVSSFDTFKKDEADLVKAIKERNEKIEELRREQSQDGEKLLRVRGALSVLQHLITIYRVKIGEDSERAKGEQCR